MLVLRRYLIVSFIALLVACGLLLAAILQTPRNEILFLYSMMIVSGVTFYWQGYMGAWSLIRKLLQEIKESEGDNGTGTET